jgi:RNA polymerase sigma-70 factor (ECF subfamily)
MEASDAELIGWVLDGNVDAYAHLVARYRDRYARYARRMLGNRDDADEALQDAFVRAYRSLERCEDRERFSAWLFRILVNRCRTAGGRRARRAQLFIHDDGALLDAAEEHPAERAALREEIERALARLVPEQREAFVLKYVEELGYDEMAELTGVGVSALKMRVKRACERLRQLLEEVESVRAE